MNYRNTPIDWENNTTQPPRLLQQYITSVDTSKMNGIFQPVIELANEFNSKNQNSGLIAIPIGYAPNGNVANSKYMLGFAQRNGVNGYSTKFVIHPDNNDVVQGIAEVIPEDQRANVYYITNES